MNKIATLLAIVATLITVEHTVRAQAALGGFYYLTSHSSHRTYALDGNATTYKQPWTSPYLNPRASTDQYQKFNITAYTVNLATFYTIGLGSTALDHNIDGPITNPNSSVHHAFLWAARSPDPYTNHLWQIIAVEGGLYRIKSSAYENQTITCLDADVQAITQSVQGQSTPLLAPCVEDKASQFWKLSADLRVGCDAGFTGDACDRDVNECADADRCGPGSVCINTFGGYYCRVVLSGGYYLTVNPYHGNIALDSSTPPYNGYVLPFVSTQRTGDQYQKFFFTAYGATSATTLYTISQGLNALDHNRGSMSVDPDNRNNHFFMSNNNVSNPYQNNLWEVTAIGDYYQIKSLAFAGRTPACMDGDALAFPTSSPGYPKPFLNPDCVLNKTTQLWKISREMPAALGCDAGYTGDACGSDVDECASGTHACLKDGTAACVNTEGGYTCACNEGFTGDGRNSCVDINECDAEDACESQGFVCVNLPGSYFCKPILSGDYYISMSPYHGFVALDTNASPFNSYTCPFLNSHFSGDQYMKFTITAFEANTTSATRYTIAAGSNRLDHNWAAYNAPVDPSSGAHYAFLYPATQGNPPDNHLWEIVAVGNLYQIRTIPFWGVPSRCLDGDVLSSPPPIQGQPTPTIRDCVAGKTTQLWKLSKNSKVGCDGGYTGDACGADVNECADGSHLCLKDGTATCANIEGGYTCACNAGYRGDGRTSCTSINQCDASKCGVGYSCVNTSAGFSCKVRLFFIKSELSPQLVLALAGDGLIGAPIVTALKKTTDFRNQLWSYDGAMLLNNGTGYVMGVQFNNVAPGAKLVASNRPTQPSAHQKFSYDSTVFSNSLASTLVFDVMYASSAPGSSSSASSFVILWERKPTTANTNQRFTMEEYFY